MQRTKQKIWSDDYLLKALGVHSLNGVSLILFVVLLNIENAAPFLENYEMTALALSMVFVMSFTLSMISACADRYASGILSLFFSFLTNMVIDIASFDTNSPIEAIWFVIVMIGILCPFGVWALWNNDEVEQSVSESDEGTDLPLIATANEEVRFGYAEFDGAFEELKGKWDFLQQNVVLLGAEKVHKAETLLNDLYKAQSIYITISEKKQKEANDLISTFMDECRDVFEHLEDTLDDQKIKQIEKLLYKHKGGSVC